MKIEDITLLFLLGNKLCNLDILGDSILDSLKRKKGTKR
jgi:hypothetical protein